MTTLVQARDQLRLDNDILGNPNFPDPLLNRYLNLAQKYVQKILNGLGIKKWETSYDGTTELASVKFNGVSVKKITMAQIKTGSTYDVGIAPNSVRFIECGDGVSLSSSTNFGIAKGSNEDTFHKLLSNTYAAPSLSEPRFLWINNSILIAPSTVTACMIHFYRVVKDLSSDSAEFEVPDEFIDHVIKRASIDVKDRQKLLNDKQEAIAQLDKEIKDQFATFMATVNEIEKDKEVELQ